MESGLARQNGDQGSDPCYDLAAQFLPLAEKQKLKAPRELGHRLVGLSLVLCGSVAEGQSHLDRSMALYDLAEDRALSTRLEQTPGWQFYHIAPRPSGDSVIQRP